MYRPAWLTRLACAGLLALLLSVSTGCSNPSSAPAGPRERSTPADRDTTKKPPDGGVKPPSPDPG